MSFTMRDRLGAVYRLGAVCNRSGAVVVGTCWFAWPTVDDGDTTAGCLEDEQQRGRDVDADRLVSSRDPAQTGCAR
jgi:hypothetical protein